MVDKRQLLGMTLEELKGVASEVGLPAYAAKQMADWIYKKKITRISEMTNIAVAKRALLEDSFEIGAYPPSEYQKTVRSNIYMLPDRGVLLSLFIFLRMIGRLFASLLKSDAK